MYSFIVFLQSLPPIALSLLMFFIAYGSVIVFSVLAGKQGLYTIIVLLIVMANIQVLKSTQFMFFNSPVALGTELFAATYLATDILAEVYGEKQARTGVLLGFMGMIFFTLVAIGTLGFAPLTQLDTNDSFLLGMHTHLEAILLPIPSFLIASICAYLVSQFLDVYLFSMLKQYTKSKFLWLRNNISTIISALIDNTVFSLLAWIVLSANPLPLSQVIRTYILGTYIFRVCAAFLDTPVIYWVKHLLSSHTQSSTFYSTQNFSSKRT